MIRDGALQVWKQTIPAQTAPTPREESPAGKPPQVPSVTPSATPAEKPSAEKPSGETAASYNDTSLKRPSLGSLLNEPKWKERLFPLVIWLPLPAAMLISLWGLLLVLRSVVSGSPALWQSGGTLLVTTGSALVLFPQYFFWRPDMVHLSEFMVPFVVALIIGLSFAARSWKSSRILGRVCLSMVILATGTDLVLYVVKGWQTDGCGSIAASRRRHQEFSAPNGVRVKLNAEEFARDTLLRDLILSHSRPGDHVVCYPYFPMVNFITDRPSYEYNLYADNAIPPDLFHEQAVRNIEEHHPSVIVIGTGKVNATEASRFPNWASRTYAFIRERYDLSGTGEEIEIYTVKSLEPTKRP
jgi:hypothetical protein